MIALLTGIVMYSCSFNKRISNKNSDVIAQQLASKENNIKADTSGKVIKAYKEIITDKAITQQGLFKVHKVDSRWYFEIPDSLMGKDILTVNRISKAASSLGADGTRRGYGGDEIGENLIQFVKGPNQKVFIKRISYLDVSHDSTQNGMYNSITNSNLQPIHAAFDIKTISPDSLSAVIDMTDYLNSDNEIFFFNPEVKKKALGLGALQPDKSYIDTIANFPLNTEIKAIKTYLFKDYFLTYELNSSIVLLPNDRMESRHEDKRVGYFSRGYRDFDNADGVKVNFMITRWRLEPKEEDINRYKRGELVEPQKPIVFYIDPATPKKWVKYLIQGVNEWQKAFEKAGFKNAIYALEVPANDSKWKLADARHNVIVYKASYIENASGPHISDPRTGEILQSHINWYHNIQQLLRDWYFIQGSPSDKRARRMVFDDELMGRLIQYVCTHEVGHTLGLSHNMAASASIPVDSLRSKTYVAANGHTPSIMDYARFNYVAQPEDSINVTDLIPRIGVYDEWAIEWGYRWLPTIQSEEQEKAYLNSWIINRTTGDKRLLYNDITLDKRVQSEDLGDDAVLASTYGIKNLKLIQSHIVEWTKTPNDLYDDLQRMNRKLIEQYQRYIWNVFASFQSAYWIRKAVEQEGPVISFQDRASLKCAINFFQRELFETPKWLDDKEIFSLIGGSGGLVEWLHNFQEEFLAYLVSPSTYNMLLFNQAYNKNGQTYTFNEFLTDMGAGLFKELATGEKIDFFRRNLQKLYITSLISVVRLQKVGPLGHMDLTTDIEGHITNLLQRIDLATKRYRDRESRLHLSDIRTRLKVVLEIQQKNYPESPRTISISNPNSFAEDKIILPKKFDLNCWEKQENFKSERLLK